MGDFVGQGALLVLAFQRSGGRLVAPAALFAVGIVPALLSAALAGSWLDQVPRHRALFVLQSVAAAAICLPVVMAGLASVFLSAAVLGAIRAATASIRAAVMAEGVAEADRGPLVSLLQATDQTGQTGQVMGYLTGSGLAVVLSATTTLLLDALCFAAGAAVLAGLSLPRPTIRAHRPPVTAGFREIWSNPTLRLMGVLVWLAVTAGALPEALAVGGTEGARRWTPFVLAAGPAGAAIAMLVLGRTRLIEQTSFQLTHLSWFAAALLIAAIGQGPAWLVIANFLIGAGSAWIVGPQVTFLHLAPAERMAQVTGTMVAMIITAQGLGTVAYGLVADRAGVGAAYLVAGLLLSLTAMAGWVIHMRQSKERVSQMVAVAP